MQLSTTSVTEAMKAAVNEVFESMAFMEAMEGQPENSPKADQPVWERDDSWQEEFGLD